MITIYQFRRKIFLTEAGAPPAGGAPPSGTSPPVGGDLGAAPPPPPSDLGGLGGSLGGATPPPPSGGLGSDLGGMSGGLGGTTGAAPPATTDIKKLNAWDLLEKYFKDKIKPKSDLEPYL